MFREMRRFKQQLPQDEADAILKRNEDGVLSLHGDNGYPYGVPVNYVWDGEKIIFHCALTGHKIDAIKADPKVCFTVIDQHEVLPQKLATRYRSVIVFGKARFVEDEKERDLAFRAFANRHSGDFPEEIEAEIISAGPRALIVEITPEHITGKESLDLLQERNKSQGSEN